MDKPFSAYRGDAPYVFVCYAHKDAKLVYPELKQLHDDNAKIWYDEGISPGKVWRGEVAQAIQNAAKFVFYVSRASIESDHCKREVEYAIDRNIEIVPIYLEETTLPADLDLVFNRIQAIHRSPNSAYSELIAEVFEVEGKVSASAGNAEKKALVLGKLATLGGVIVIAVIIGYGLVGERAQPTTDSDSSGQQTTIAVLPLRNISGTDEFNYIADAISEEISQQLSSLPEARIISMNSSRRYAGSDLDTRVIADELTATHIVEGSFNRAKNGVRINMQLVNGSSGVEDWSGSFEQNLDDIEQLFAMYELVSVQIVASMGHHFGRHEGPSIPMLEPPTTNSVAYHLYNRAWFSFRQTGNTKDSLALIDQALELDSGFSEAVAGKASLVYLAAELGHIPTKSGFEKARALALEAIELDPSSAYPYAVLGGVYDRLDLDFRAAIEQFQKVEELGGAVANSGWLQDTYMNAGLYEEGLSLMRQATLVNPGDANSIYLLSRFLYRLGRVEEAREMIELSLRLGPNHAGAISEALHFFLFLHQDPERAAEIIATTDEKIIPLWAKPNLALILGDRRPLQKAVEEWERNRDTKFVRARTIYVTHYRLGNYAEHIRWLKIREEERDILGWIMDELRLAPDYWSNLREWALSDPSMTRGRLELIDSHRARIDRITEKMVL